MGKQVRATLLLLLTAMIWGFAFVAQQYGAQGGIGTFTFNAIRFTLGSLSLVPVVLLFEKEQLSKEKKKKLVICSILGGSILFVASNLQQYGIELGVSAGKAGFLTGTYTVIVPLAGLVFFKYKNSIFAWIGAFLAVFGLFLINLDEDFNFKIGYGEVMIILCAVFWALHIIVVDNFVKGISPLKFSLGQFIVNSVLSFIFAFIFEDNVFDISIISGNIIPILYCGILSVGVAYTCQVVAQKDANPTFSAIVFSTESVFSMVGQIVLLKIFPNKYGYMGCAFIFIAIIVSQIDISKFRRKDRIRKALGEEAQKNSKNK